MFQEQGVLTMIRTEAGRRLDINTEVLKELEIGECVQLQNLRGKHPLKSDQAGVVTAKNGFSNFLLKIFESGLVTKRNRASLRKVDPRSVQRGQSENLLLGQELRAGDKVASRVPPARQELSPALGGEVVINPLGCPVQTIQLPALLSRPVAAPVDGLVDSHEQERVKTSQPVQGVVEQPGLPGPGVGLASSQVDLISQDTSNSSNGFRRSSRVTKQTDFYGR